jgi:hypothetical protein
MKSSIIQLSELLLKVILSLKKPLRVLAVKRIKEAPEQGASVFYPASHGGYAWFPLQEYYR